MANSRNDSITVVTGLPRSGTSMMMRALEAGGIPVLTDDLRPADQDNPHGYYEFAPALHVGTDHSWLDQARGRAVKLVYLLLHELPPTCEYRVLFMRRSLPEVIASQHAMLARQGKPRPELTDAQLARAFQTDVSRVEAWLNEQPCFSVMHVRYADVLAHPERVMRDVGEFLGGALRWEAMASVVDAALYRQRQ